MLEGLKKLWRRFYDWVEGNGPRPENEVAPPEPPPALPFAQRPRERSGRFLEPTIRQRREEWLEHNGLGLFETLYSALSVVACVGLVALLLATVAELPPFGEEANPANNEVTRRYIERGATETGAQNIVAGMILDYRAFDTFGESAVLFTGSVSVIMLLAGMKKEKRRSLGPDPILQGVAPVAIPAILMLGCVVVVNGHLSPGGGFSGGAILSAALILCANAWGPRRVHSFFTERTFVAISSSALLVYAAAKGYSFFTGANGLESGIPTGTVGNIFSGGLILPLNVCVGLVVAGTLYGLYALFSEGEI